MSSSAPTSANRRTGLQEIRLCVVSTTPRGVVQIARDTEIELLPEAVEIEELRRADVTISYVGGLGDKLNQVREMIELPLKHPELFDAGHRAAPGRAAVRPAGHGQDADRRGGGQ